MASSDGVKEPHSFLSHSVGFPSAALIPVAKELLRNLMCMRIVRLLSPLPYHKEESALSLLSLYLSAGRVEADNRSNIKVRVQWYYRPEESMGGRRQFHGAKELFLSDHYDVQSAHTIEGKCTVHSFKNYTKLENVGTEDYYCRFEYKAATGAFTPDRVAVYCKCEMPYNPDDLMVQCEGCKDWSLSVSSSFHSAANSDIVWERLLPFDYEDVVSRSVTPLKFSSKKEIFVCLCDPILTDGGNKVLRGKSPPCNGKYVKEFIGGVDSGLTCLITLHHVSRGQRVTC